jgi:hypothetical protein
LIFCNPAWKRSARTRQLCAAEQQGSIIRTPAAAMIVAARYRIDGERSAPVVLSEAAKSAVYMTGNLEEQQQQQG